jgi:hypothetical protein
LATVRQDHAAALQTLTEEHEAKIAGELIWLSALAQLGQHSHSTIKTAGSLLL